VLLLRTGRCLAQCPFDIHHQRVVVSELGDDEEASLSRLQVI
jgi:hypothetical protein